MNEKYMSGSYSSTTSAFAKKSMKTGVLAGIMLNANFLAAAISNVVSVSNIYIYLLVAAALLVLAVNGFKLPVLREHLLIVLVIAVQLLFGKISINSEMTDRFMLCFIGVGLTCLVLVSYQIDIDAMLLSLIFSSLICIPYYMILFRMTFTVYNAGNQMGIAYSIIPSIMASIIITFRNDKPILRVLSIVVGAMGVLVLFRMMTRGAYLCLFIFIMGFICVMNQEKKSKKLMVILAMVFAIGLFAYFFGERIVSSTWFYRLFGTKEGNILNGRERDLEIAFSWRGMDKFLLGSGIGSFKKFEYTEYIHNILGQIYYEQGIYSVIFIVIIIFKTITAFFGKKVNNKNEKIILLMLFCAGIVRLMVSYYFWIDQYFWVLVWVILGNRYDVIFIDRYSVRQQE